MNESTAQFFPTGDFTVVLILQVKRSGASLVSDFERRAEVDHGEDSHEDEAVAAIDVNMYHWG